MNRHTIPLALLTLLAPTAPARADAVVPPAIPAGAACRQAIAAAERAHAIPAHLLAAIARVESGRRDQVSGTFNPWPWTINADGAGSFYDTKPQAVAAAQGIRPHVATSIDVGCMQISLTFHPDAFRDMEQAFDPASNADYGARFLTQLYAKTNSWPKAVEMYHSATAEIGQDYGRRVYAAWPEEQRLAEATQPYSAASPWSSPVGRGMLFAPFHASAPRIVAPVQGPMGTAPPGRSLASYWSATVRLAIRAP